MLFPTVSLQGLTYETSSFPQALKLRNSIPIFFFRPNTIHAVKVYVVLRMNLYT